MAATDVLHLLVDGDGLVKQIDVLAAQRHQLPCPQPGVRSDEDEDAIPGIDMTSERGHIFVTETPHRLRLDSRRLDTPQRVAAQQVVVDDGRKDPVERPVRLGYGAGCQALAVTSDFGRERREPGPQH
jgi:hypothetical protein